MITKALTHPQSIVVVGGSNDIHKPGGKVLKNLVDHHFEGKLYVLNPKEESVQGIKSYREPEALPPTDLAVIAIAAKYTPDLVDYLAEHKGTRAFIVLSAGFGEESEEGKQLEKRLVETVNKVGGSLIGPNCIGVITPRHASVFTLPIPALDPKGCDFISGSGATACFIMEAGITKGLKFAHVYSVGNSAQMGVEDILRHMDEHYDPEKDSNIKLLYLETIEKPDMLLKHAASLISKGCSIAAIKAGASEAGSRAASSHTGALATPDAAVDALFRKAGIVRCHSREELIDVASVFTYPPLQGKNMAVITHAGGPAVMLTDSLSNGGLFVPAITGEKATELKDQLFPGSSVANPIDFLATGTAEQLGLIIDYVNEAFPEIDAMVVIFGTPGLSEIFDVYDVLDKKLRTTAKPIFPVLPSVLTARREIDAFVKKGWVYFSDEVSLGSALGKIYGKPLIKTLESSHITIDTSKIRKVIEEAENGYLNPGQVQQILDGAGIPRAAEKVISTDEELESINLMIPFPVVMKVVGPVHKTDVGGVVLNVEDLTAARDHFRRLMQIPDAEAVLIQPMLSGIELFAGLKKEPKFGHLILFGLGGIFIEIFKDVRTLLSPLNKEEIEWEIRQLAAYPILKGTRGKEGINQEMFTETILRLSALAHTAPEIAEMDLNPLLASAREVTAVDARIRIDK
ncbi:MAG: acetate--CoA ligase family protein [bacterium]